MAKTIRTAAELKAEAKAIQAKALAEAQAMIKRAKQMEKTERQETIECLGKLTERYAEGGIAFEFYVEEIEKVSGIKSKRELPGKKANAEISA